MSSVGAPPLRDAGVRVLGRTIADIGPAHELRSRYPEDRVDSKPGRIVVPGFVDGHAHLYGVLAHGIPPDNAPADFRGFLEGFWWPLVEDRLDHEMNAAAGGWGGV